MICWNSSPVSASFVCSHSRAMHRSRFSVYLNLTLAIFSIYLFAARVFFFFVHSLLCLLIISLVKWTMNNEALLADSRKYSYQLNLLARYFISNNTNLFVFIVERERERDTQVDRLKIYQIIVIVWIQSHALLDGCGSQINWVSCV